MCWSLISAFAAFFYLSNHILDCDFNDQFKQIGVASQTTDGHSCHSSALISQTVFYQLQKCIYKVPSNVLWSLCEIVNPFDILHLKFREDTRNKSFNLYCRVQNANDKTHATTCFKPTVPRNFDDTYMQKFLDCWCDCFIDRLMLRTSSVSTVLHSCVWY